MIHIDPETNLPVPNSPDFRWKGHIGYWVISYTPELLMMTFNTLTFFPNELRRACACARIWFVDESYRLRESRLEDYTLEDHAWTWIQFSNKHGIPVGQGEHPHELQQSKPGS